MNLPLPGAPQSEMEPYIRRRAVDRNISINSVLAIPFFRLLEPRAAGAELHRALRRHGVRDPRSNHRGDPASAGTLNRRAKKPQKASVSKAPHTASLLSLVPARFQCVPRDTFGNKVVDNNLFIQALEPPSQVKKNR